MKYTVLYVDDGTPKFKSFKDKNDALNFAKPIIEMNKDFYWVDGLVIGEYIRANLDGEEEDIIKRLK
jgi:hypothetical protein